MEDLPRVDVCSNGTSERLTIDRGLLHSPNTSSLSTSEDVICRKELFLPRQSRLRLFLLDQSRDYSPELKIQLANQIRTVSEGDLLDVNITTSKRDELLKFQWRINPGQFLLYFQGKFVKRGNE